MNSHRPELSTTIVCSDRMLSDDNTDTFALIDKDGKLWVDDPVRTNIINGHYQNFLSEYSQKGMDEHTLRSMFSPLFIHEQKLYLIGNESRGMLEERGIDFTHIKYYDDLVRHEYLMGIDMENVVSQNFKMLSAENIVMIEAVRYEKRSSAKREPLDKCLSDISDPYYFIYYR